MALFGSKKETVKKEESPKEEKKTAVAAGKKKTSSSERMTNVLLRPRITEKATIVTEAGAYVFEVDPRVTKVEVAEAVKKFYNVTPRKVNIVRIPRKKIQSRRRGRFGLTAGGKKAYVYLKEGDTIELV